MPAGAEWATSTCRVPTETASFKERISTIPRTTSAVYTKRRYCTKAMSRRSCSRSGPIWIDPSETDEASMLQTNIKNYIEQNALQFITGNKRPREGLGRYVKGLKDLKLDRYLEILQKAYDSSAK